MDFSADYIRARKTADDMTPPSQEAIDALSTPSVEIPPPGPANYGQPGPGMPGNEISTLTGKAKEKPPALVPSHETPEDSLWDTMVKGARAMPGIAKQAVGGARRAAGEFPHPMGGDKLLEAAGYKDTPEALIAKGTALAAEGAKDVQATLPNVPAGSFKAHLYGAIQSVGLNVGAIGMGLATQSPTIPLLLMGAISGGQDYAENRAAGVGKETAWIGALANGAAEYFGEKLPLHAYLNKGATMFRRAITGALLELPGELGTQVVQSAEEMLTRNPGMTWEDFMETMKDTAIQTLMATTMTGGIFGAAGAIAGGAKAMGEKGSVGEAKPAAAPEAFDDETFKAEALRLGVEYRGITALGERKAGIFQDEKTGSFAVQPGETVENGLNRVRERFGLSPLLTPEKIMTAFPGAAVAAGEGETGGFRVALPNGANITILPDQTIELDPSTGVTLEPGEKLAGEYTKKIGPEAIIRLAKEGAGDDTLLHESFHAAMDFALTPEEKAAVLTEHDGDVEVAAQAYAEWTPEASGHPFFAKIRAFFQKMREMLLGPTAEGTFGRLRSGEAWTRGAQGGTEGTSYQTKPASNAPAFFSKLLQTIDEKMPNAAPASDVRALLRSQGVKADEIRWSGIEHLLSSKEKLTKEEVRSWVEANTIQVFDVTPPPKYENTSYILPGQKKNYVELLLTLSEEAFEGPATKALSAFQVQMARKYRGDRYGSGWASKLTPEEQATYKDLQQKFGGELVGSLPKIGHFSETPGTIAHIRFDERRTAAGGRMLFIEEIQSDWHQKGRDNGYATDVLPEGYGIAKTDDGKTWTVHKEGSSVPIGGLKKSQAAAMRAALKIINKDRVPEAPFKGSWPELALKRMIRYAAENGYDSIGWTTGAQQADRYNLARYVDKLTYVQSPDGTYTLVGDKNAGQVFLQEKVPQDKIADYVGKEMAGKIRDSGKASGDFTGLDLQVGGQGMNYFYDKMIPSFVEKYGKRWGVKVETEQFGRNKTYHPYILGKDGLLTPLTERGFESEEEARSAMNRKLSAAGKKDLRILADTGSGFRIHWAEEGTGPTVFGTVDLAYDGTFPTFEAAQKQAVEMAKDVASNDDQPGITWRNYFQDLMIKPAEGPGEPTGYRVVGDITDVFNDDDGGNNFPSPEKARQAVIDYLRDPWYEDPEMFDRQPNEEARRVFLDNHGRSRDEAMERDLAAYVDASYTFEPIMDQQIIGYRVLDESGEDIEPLPGHQHPPEIRTEADAKALARDYAAETLEQIAELDPEHPDFQRQVDIFVQEQLKIQPIYGGQQVHSLKITPQMKEDVLGKGQPLYQIRRKADSPPFVSQLRNVVADEKMFPPSMKAPSVINTLMKYGVKAAEIQDTGLATFLADKPRVTREQLLDFIDMNMVRVEEKIRTDDASDQVEELDFSEPQPDDETGEYPEDPEWFAQGMSATYVITPWKNGKYNLEVTDRDDLGSTPYSSATGSVAELIRHANEVEREAARTVGNVKFEGEVLLGAGKNYRELLIMLPRPKLANFPSRAAYDAAISNARPPFNSTHWDEDDVLAHIRFDERVDAAGKQTLFIEEVQSDWHLQGRRNGYIPKKIELPDTSRWTAITEKHNQSTDQRDVRVLDENGAFIGLRSGTRASDAEIIADFARRESTPTHGVPDAPFKDTWWELTMKRAIRWAAEHGHDSISWTTGEQQQDRYDLSKRIDSLEIKKATNDTGYVVVGNKGGMGVVGKTYPREKLPDAIGTDIASKALSELDALEAKPGGDEYRGVKYSGLDLKIGGEWAVNLYDKTIPGWLNKYAKKWGVQVRDEKLSTNDLTLPLEVSGPAPSVSDVRAEANRIRHQNPPASARLRDVLGMMENGASWEKAAASILSIAEIEKFGGKADMKKVTVHSLRIPPAMAADVLKKGQPLYQKKSGRFPGEPNDKGYTFNSNDAEEVKNAGRAVLLGVWPDVEFTQSNEETEKRAQTMLDEGIVNIERLLARDQNQSFETPELMVAADRLRHGVNKRLVDTGKQWLQGDGSVTDAEMKNAIALSAGLTQVLQGGISQTGRVLQARQIAFEGQEPGSKQWTEAVSGTLESLRQLQGAEGMPLEAIVRKIMAVPEPSTFIPKLVKITSKDMFIEAWYGALLSNPVTHAANFIGNTVALFSSIPERGLASLAHRLTGKGEGVAPGEAFAALYGAVAGFQDAIRFAGHTARTGESKFAGDRMERRVREPAITGANLGASGPIGAAVDLLGMAIRGPGRALLTSDEFFKAVNFRMEVYAQAYREAYSEGLTGDDLKNRMAEMVENPPEQIQETAAEWANYQTFTNALGPIGSAIVAFSNSHPAMKVVLPFVATPTNILKYTFERLGPLSLALKSVREDISSGGSRRDLAIARVSLGSMVMGTAAYLAAAGFITGGGPKDKDLLSAKRRTGWQPYSFHIGDKYYSFSRMEPYATLFGMTADMVEMAGERSDLEIDAMAKALVLSFAKNMTSKTYLSGVSDALDAITDPDKSGPRFIHRFVGSWVPAGVAQVARIVDPVRRDTYGPTSRGEPNALVREAKSMLREWTARTPGRSKTLPPRRNLWGDPVLLEGGLGPDLISPIYQSTEKFSPADDEIIRNKVSIGMPARFVYGSRPSDDIQMRDESVRTGIPLTPKEYDFLIRVAAGLKVEVDGQEYQVAEQTLKQDLEEMIKSPEYKAATDGPDGGKALMIRSRVTAYRDAAKAMLFDASPELAGLYEEKIQSRGRALVGGE